MALRDADDFALESFGPEAVANTVPRPENTGAAGAPTIAGTARAGETLTASTDGIADADGLSGATFALQWVSSADGTETDIAGATGASYLLADADVGAAIKVRASFTEDAGNDEELTSAPTAGVEARPLTAESQGMPAEHDGRRPFSFELVFSENFPGRFPYQDAQGQRVHGDQRQRALGGARRERREPALDDQRAPLLERRRDDRAAGGVGVHRVGPCAVEQLIRASGWPGGHFGCGRAGGGGRRRGAGLRGHAEPCGDERVHGGLRHVGR